jgi:hypothetical protein
MICLTYRDLIVIGLIYVASGLVSGFIRGFARDPIGTTSGERPE